MKRKTYDNASYSDYAALYEENEKLRGEVNNLTDNVYDYQDDLRDAAEEIKRLRHELDELGATNRKLRFFIKGVFHEIANLVNIANIESQHNSDADCKEFMAKVLEGMSHEIDRFIKRESR